MSQDMLSQMSQDIPQQGMMGMDLGIRSQLRQVMLRLLMQRRMQDRQNPMGMQMPTSNDVMMERSVGNIGNGY